MVSDEIKMPKKRHLTIALLLYAAPIVGILGAALFMMRAFSVLSEDGGADPSDLADSIQGALYVMIPFLILGLFGFGLMLSVVLRKGQRESGFFWKVLLLSAFYCFLSFPFGLLFGGSVIAALLSKRREFFPVQLGN